MLLALGAPDSLGLGFAEFAEAGRLVDFYCSVETALGEVMAVHLAVVAVGDDSMEEKLSYEAGTVSRVLVLGREGQAVEAELDVAAS